MFISFFSVDIQDQDYEEVEPTPAPDITYVSEPGEPGARGPPGVSVKLLLYPNPFSIQFTNLYLYWSNTAFKTRFYLETYFLRNLVHPECKV